MNNSFSNSLIRYLIEKEYFSLISAENEQLDFSNGTINLIKNFQGTSVLLEIIDADRYGNEQIIKLMENGAAMLNNIEGTNASIFRLFIFDSTPSEEKIAIIEQGQVDIVTEQKFMKCFSVDIMSKQVQKHFSVPNFDANIVKAMKLFFSKNLDARETTAEDITDLIAQRQKDFDIQLKTKQPWFTYGLVAANIIFFLILKLIASKNGTSYANLLEPYGAKVNSLIMNGEYWRFISPMFLHSDIVHLGVNCYSLYIVGMQVEKLFGHGKFIAIYFVSGILGCIVSFAFSINNSVGASGAIFGLLGAMLFFAMKRPALLKSNFGVNLVTTLVINLVYGFMNTQIDNHAHIGGLIGGFLTTGAVYSVNEKTSKDKLSRITALILMVAVLIGGLFYGFNNKQNQIAPKITAMDTYFSQKNYSETEKLAEEILAKNPSNKSIRLDALWSLSVSEMAQQKYNESEEHGEELLKIGLEEDIKTETLWNLCLSEASQVKFDEAKEHAKQLIELSPKHGHFILGAIYYNLKDVNNAKVELQKAKDLGSPNMTTIDNMLSEIENMQKSK